MANLMDNIFPGENGIANKLINLFGDSAIVNTSTLSYNAEDGTSDPKLTQYEIISTPPLSYTVKDYDNSNILRGDLYCIINADTLHKTITTVSFQELKNGTILINDICYDIISITPIHSGKLIAAFKLQIRGTK